MYASNAILLLADGFLISCNVKYYIYLAIYITYDNPFSLAYTLIPIIQKINKSYETSVTRVFIYLEQFKNMRFDNLEENYGKRKVCESFRKALLAHITCT